MRKIARLSFKALKPDGAPVSLETSSEVEIPELSASEAPVTFSMRTRMMGEYGRIQDVAEAPFARKALGAWWTPVATDPLTDPDSQDSVRFWRDLAARLASPGIGPMGPKTDHGLPRRFDDERRESLFRMYNAALEGSVAMVDGKLHMRVGEPVWCVASRSSVSSPITVRFSDMLKLEAGFAIYSLGDEAGARELMAAGFSRAQGRDWQEPDPQVEFDRDALDRVDQLRAPSEIAWCMQAACSLGKAACLPVDALMAIVPLKRAVESRAILDADAVRVMLGPIEKAIGAVGPVDFPGTARTPDQFARMHARQSLLDLRFLSRALSRLNATYVPTDDDEAALSGLDL